MAAPEGLSQWISITLCQLGQKGMVMEDEDKIERDGGPENGELNPYAPPETAAHKMLPGAAGIDLSGHRVTFAGKLTQQDVTRALNKASSTTTMLVMAGIFMLLVGSLIFLSGTGLSILSIPLVFLPALFLYIGYRESGWRRARKIAKTSPRSFVEHGGEISERLIRYRSQYGWSEYPWESIVGINLHHECITLAMTPQHSSFIFLPKRFFAAEDWERLYFSLTVLAPALPFRAGYLQQADARRMTAESLPELDRVPPDSIMLDGHLKTSEFLTSPVGYRLVRNWILMMILVGTIVVTFIFATDVFQIMGQYVFLFLIVPVAWLYRFGKLVWAMFGKNSKPIVRLRAAASETMLRLATPRGNSGVYWSAMGDAVIGENLILLRETAHSPNIVPLPREALVDARQWDQLVDLVRRKVGENESP